MTKEVVTFLFPGISQVPWINASTIIIDGSYTTDDTAIIDHLRMLKYEEEVIIPAKAETVKETVKETAKKIFSGTKKKSSYKKADKDEIDKDGVKDLTKEG